MKNEYIFVSITGEIHHIEEGMEGIVIHRKHNEWYFKSRPYCRYKIGKPSAEMDSFIGVYENDGRFIDLYLEHLKIIPRERHVVASEMADHIIPANLIDQLNMVASERGTTLADLLDSFLDSIGFYGEDDGWDGEDPDGDDKIDSPFDFDPDGDDSDQKF